MAWIELEHLSHCYHAGTEQEHITTHDGSQPWRFTLPWVQLDARALEGRAGEW